MSSAHVRIFGYFCPRRASVWVSSVPCALTSNVAAITFRRSSVRVLTTGSWTAAHFTLQTHQSSAAHLHSLHAAARGCSIFSGAAPSLARLLRI